MRRLWIPMKCGTTGADLTSEFVLGSTDWFLTSSGAARGGGGRAGRLDVSGNFLVDAAYRGCGTCGANSFVRCGDCANLTCSTFGATHFTFPWCGGGGVITPGVSDVRAADGSS